MILRQNTISILIMVILIITLLFSMTLFFLVLAEKNRIEADINSKCAMINGFAAKSRVPLTEGTIAVLTEEQNKLEKIYNRFKTTLESPLDKDIPQGDLEPLKFKEKLVQTQKRLRENARRGNLILPASLGFTKYESELSRPSDIPDLIKRLNILEELIRLMALSGVYSLDEINFAATTTADDICYNIPLSVKIGCTSAALMDLLYKLRTSPVIFVVDSFDVTNARAQGDTEEVYSVELNARLSMNVVALKQNRK